MQNQIEIYQSQDGSTQVEVQFNQETVWLSLQQMADIFGRDKSVISRHLRNIFKEGELDPISTVAKNATVQKEGNRLVERNIEFYNLDVIISVGYRVNSKAGTQFRIWATQRLKEYLVQGYTLNQKRLTEKGVEFSQVIALLDRTLSNQTLVNEEGKAVLNVVQEYARSWSLLQAYDEQSLNSKQQKQNEMRPLLIQDVEKAIAQLKQTLIEKGEATPLFANPRNDGLISAINTIEQGFGDELFYPNIASRAAHLLYFIIKNHPLTDGNKRTGAFLFLWYLRLNQHLLAKSVEQLINDNTLVALALLVAESLPEQKELMIKLIEHFILLK
ncbi:virulence protein RhuM/Fic/DOC family protein [Avibacterium paragallinarum]|uniref:virulence protein RhuM/Fic/DOC family protein n=1 Tax=Avibacterium paragallinarum TaxID=728 RepID=UPI0021F7241F|nr:virulence protein RhuM/Fic/DOC family protein [Avibacterium paragallinarum]UXN35277.1 virulence RhuM family protein [Avibacterium paragallinarum]